MNAPKEWYDTDYYQALGVAADATVKDVTKAYRKLARELHPDKNPGDAAAEERFKKVSAAYHVLGDVERRKEYDEIRRLGPMAGGGHGGGPGGFTFNAGNGGFGGDVGDLLGQMFNRSGRQSGRGGVGPQRGADVSARLTMDFVDAVNGITTALHLTSDARCSTCGGNGAKPGTTPTACGVCGGRGVVDDNQGMFSFSSPCKVCRGTGSIIVDPCGTCHGSGVERRPREVKVRIPAGVNDGQTIRLAGRGAPGRNGGPAGDLLVEISVIAHDRFARSGDNLTVKVPITFPQAALGADIAVPTLDGGTVTMSIKPGTQSGSRHRVKGRGITITNKAGDRVGDLIVTVDVAVPTSLTDSQRAAIEQFAAASTVDGESS
ncbi:MAG TPA: J domain-containing protein [Ilumatobacter sp.]|nr:J domain-containing protein [Ilumatobacter sp.]